MIEHIKIQNYKSIRALELDLRAINILIGSNGAGKSNFISFFKMVDFIYEGRLQEFVGKYGVDSLLYLGRKSSDFISGFLDFDSLNAYSFRLEPTLRDSFRFMKEKHYLNKLSPKYNQEYDSWSSSSIINGQNETGFKGKYKTDWDDSYLKSFKIYHFHDTSETSKMKQSCNVDDNRYLREDGSNLAAFLYYLQERHPMNLKRITQTIRSIAPFFRGFDLQPNRLRPDMIKLEWNEKGTDMYLDAHHLSDGTLRFIALTALLLQPTLPTTIIIDEPELGLHPAAIVKLAALIRRAATKSQVIISTQSMNLVDQFEPEDIVTVDRKERQSVFTRQDKVKLAPWLEEYSMSDLWDKNVIGGRP